MHPAKRTRVDEGRAGGAGAAVAPMPEFHNAAETSLATRVADPSKTLGLIDAERPLWLLKLPPMVAELWQGEHARGKDLATVTWGMDAMTRRPQPSLVVNPELLEHLPPEQAEATPVKFSLQKDVPDTLRVMSDATSGSSLVGVAHRLDNVMPGYDDPKYRAYRDRQAAVSKAEAVKKTTSLAPVLTARSVAKKEQKFVGIVVVKPTVKEVVKAEAGHVASFMDAFTVRSHWSKKELRELFAGKHSDDDINDLLSTNCNYVQGGEHHGKYGLKQHLLDAIAAASGGGVKKE